MKCWVVLVFEKGQISGWPTVVGPFKSKPVADTYVATKSSEDVQMVAMLINNPGEVGI